LAETTRVAPTLDHTEECMSDNAEKVKDIIEKELGVEREKLTDDASFIEDLGADSLDIVELVMEFEKEFNIDIPDEDAEKLKTVGDAMAYLNRKLDA
jgi:acyl carrier protein